MHRFNRLPVVDTTINDRGPFKLIVDTGSAGVVLKSGVADRLDLPSPPGIPAGAAKVQMASPGGRGIPASLVYIDKLRLGKAEFRGIWTVAAELPFGDGTDGIIGFNVFEDCLLTFDYPAARLRLSRGSLPGTNARDILSYSTPRMPGSHPVIELKVAGDPWEFTVDTGMRGWFGLDEERAKQLTILRGPVPGPKSLAVDESTRSKVARADAAFSIGRYTVEQPILRLMDQRGGAVVGTLFLEHFVVTFDQRNKQVRFDRNSDVPITPPPMRGLGLGLKSEGGRLKVWDVHPESHAASVGITVGDIVLAFNGRPAQDIYDTSDWYALLQSAKTVKVRYARHGREAARDVEVRVLELLP